MKYLDNLLYLEGTFLILFHTFFYTKVITNTIPEIVSKK